MGIVYSSQVESPVTEVFAWHERAGAVTRLNPPWAPVGVRREATSLRDGDARLTLLGGVPWVAQHQSSGYDPPHRFVDILSSLPLRALLSWRHTHEFSAEPDGTTRVTDSVDTPVPAALLRPMFAYRHRQLADDLGSHQWARGYQVEPLTVAVSGASGLVGSALTAFLSTGGHRVIRLVRGTPHGPDERRWRPEDPDPGLLSGTDAFIHLAGASIAGRFTEAHKRAVRESRVEPTRKLAELAADTPDGPSTFITASAIGFYGPDRGDEVLNEDSRRGEGFLADVVADWEGANRPAAEAGLRTVQIRTGIVQTPEGGVLRLFYPLFAAGLGGRLGTGRQWTSWIGIDDLIDVYYRALIDPTMSGPVNAVAPHPVRNTDYASVLARVLRRPAVVPAPELGPRTVLGQEGADELALASQRVHPERLISAGHTFRHPQLAPALRHQLGRDTAPVSA